MLPVLMQIGLPWLPLVLRFVRKYNFDGIDLDWEFPGDTEHGGRTEDKDNYVLLVQAIREAFDAAGDFIITVATPVSQQRLNEGFDLTGLAQGIDFFHIMTYNIHSHYQQDMIIGANTDMASIFNTIQFFLDAGVSPSKIVLGLAAYGRHLYSRGQQLCDCWLFVC
jgi:chitinase